MVTVVKLDTGVHWTGVQILDDVVRVSNNTDNFQKRTIPPVFPPVIDKLKA